MRNYVVVNRCAFPRSAVQQVWAEVEDWVYRGGETKVVWRVEVRGEEKPWNVHPSWVAGEETSLLPADIAALVAEYALRELEELDDPTGPLAFAEWLKDSGLEFARDRTQREEWRKLSAPPDSGELRDAWDAYLLGRAEWRAKALASREAAKAAVRALIAEWNAAADDEPSAPKAKRSKRKSKVLIGAEDA